MTDLADIRAGLAAAIVAVVTNAQVTGYTVINPMPPFFDIELARDGVDYDEAMIRGVDFWRMTVRGVVAANDSLAAQKNLDVWCASSGSLSVKAAIEADRTLGNKVQTLQVTHLSNYAPVGVLLHPNNAYLGAEWTVEIYARG